MRRRIWRRSKGVSPLLCRQCWLNDISINVSLSLSSEQISLIEYKLYAFEWEGCLTIFLCYHESIPGGSEAGASDNELGTADLPSSVDDTGQIVVVSLLAIVDAPKYGVG